MTGLELLLYVKIGVTLVACVVPMLVLPAARVGSLFAVDSGAVPLVRLYGIAITALLVGYGSGVVTAEQGAFPTGVVLMGVVSNLGAGTFLFASGTWRQAPPLAVIFGAIGLGLVWALAAPDPWMQPLIGA